MTIEQQRDLAENALDSDVWQLLSDDAKDAFLCGMKCASKLVNARRIELIKRTA